MTPDNETELELEFLRSEVETLAQQLKHLVKAEHALTRARREGERQLARIKCLADFAFNIAGVEDPSEIFTQARGALLDQFELDEVTLIEIDGVQHCLRTDQASHALDSSAWTRLIELHAPSVATPDESTACLLLDALSAMGVKPTAAEPRFLVWIPIKSCSGPTQKLLIAWTSRTTGHHRDLPQPEHVPFLELFANHITRALDSAHFTSELRRQGAELTQSNLRLQTSLTDLEKTQAQLVQAQKLEALGRLSGGIAHDFNNLLTVIVSHADLLRPAVETQLEAREDLGAIVEAAGRAAEITHRLLTFGRQRETTQQVVDLNALTIDLSRMLRRLIGDDIVLQLDLDPSVGRVRADAVQLEQILLNLVVNARDAMPRGGRLTLETRHARHADTLNENDGLATANLIALCVRDTGVGMDDATRKQLFEPFFTTKPVGKGTGLGLATVYGLVKQNQGRVTVDSTSGVGSCFTVLLPSAEGISGADLHAPTTVSRGNVLVVEDEDAIRRMVSRVLRKSGFEVVEARDGNEALATAERVKAIDLVLTDVVMPSMGGPELVNRLRVVRPDLRVVFMSGQTYDRLDVRTLDKTVESFLPKPFTAEQLRGIVEKAFVV